MAKAGKSAFARRLGGLGLPWYDFTDRVSRVRGFGDAAVLIRTDQGRQKRDRLGSINDCPMVHRPSGERAGVRDRKRVSY